MTTDDRQGSAERAAPTRAPIVVAPGEGRRYPCGPMTATFLADGDETADRWSVSEWVLEPRSPGPGEHAHEGNDDAFYVLEGQVTFVVDGVDHVAGPGTLVAAPAGVRHDFRNDGDVPVRFLNLYVPGGFEAEMGPIVDWYARNP
jgi:mannose-6-phosphate isomerase-like protein (cupin superfamily)